MRLLFLGSLAIALLGVAAPVFAEPAAQEARPADGVADAAGTAEFQSFDAKFQTTYVWQRHPGFTAAYSGPNSLSAEREKSFSLSATAFFGLRPWQGGEVYFNPEMVASREFSDLHGLGGLPNGENQKGGGADPKFYNARLFLRQTWGLGGGSEKVESAPNQLAGSADKNRVVLTVGKLSVADLFDNNAYSHDARGQFLNWTLMSLGAFDFAADARGYTWGAALEVYQGEWAYRIGRFEQPAESNGLPLDTRLLKHYGDQAEIERGYEIAGQPGKLKFLAFHNRAFMGGFADALNAWRAGGSLGVPDVAAVRQERQKTGWGVNLEQAISSDVGLFLRASGNDGGSETYAFTEVERSISGGVSIKGSRWGRAEDTFGLGLVQNGLSAAHQAYLAAGGLGAFIGDGAPPPGTSYRYAPERVFETYYSARLLKGFFLSLDYQHAWNPAYNADRGPVSFYAARLHLEY